MACTQFGGKLWGIGLFLLKLYVDVFYGYVKIYASYFVLKKNVARRLLLKAISYYKTFLLKEISIQSYFHEKKFLWI